MDDLPARLDEVHARVRRVALLRYWTWCVRVLLALAFLPSGSRKVVNEPFTRDPGLGDVSVMFTTLYEDFGALYVFIGVCQVSAALLLLVPRTAALGAVIYLPVVTGIVVLTTSLDFGWGTPVITWLMLAGVVYLLCWDWHRVRPIVAAPEPPERAADGRSRGRPRQA